MPVTEKAIRLKNGTTLPAGLPVQFVQNEPRACLVTSPERAEPFKVRVVNAFQKPSLDELQEAVDDGHCPTVAGESVECDGWDHHGSPSWLLALGMI